MTVDSIWRPNNVALYPGEEEEKEKEEEEEKEEEKVEEKNE